ncbi:MAG: restriction endonuclease subunit S [Gammaproteobacteria bacterium]|nr:restriction endonuclease subunit S [Gammaproteobacteria bacterium]MDE0258287.1 restriction endonuclease subunit S [Gammaproteobacteria bacterium]
MNAERLLVLYDRVVDAPDAIDRMRRFVLDLAVRGKLVEQDPADEPASKLLKRIAAEKARRTNAARTRRKKAVHPQMAPAPFDLPRTWCWASLGAVFHYDAGTKCDPKALDTSAWLLELRDIEKGTGRLLNRVRTSERESKSTKSRFLPGDVLYGKLRPYLNKVIVADETGYSTTEIVAIRPYLQLSSEYCALALRRPDFVDYVTRLGQGTKMPRLRTKDAVVAPFPLPPLAEQRRIVAKVDELFALCDRLDEAHAAREDTRDRLTNASLARLTAPATDAAAFRGHARFAVHALPALTARADQVKHLRQTILRLAVGGKLVKQDSADEPASELLKQIAAKKARLLKARKIRKRILTGSLSPPAAAVGLPSGWIAARLSDVVVGLQTGPFGSSLHKSDYKMGGTPVVNPASIRNGKIVPVEKMAVGTDTLERLANFKLRAGDIVMGRRGEMGRCAVVAEDEDGWLCGTGSLILRLSDSVCADYLAMLIGSPDVREYLQGSSVGTTMRNLNQSILLAMSIGLPPLAEQRRIVAKVDALMALCDQLEAEVRGADGIRSSLLDSLLHESLASQEASINGTAGGGARVRASPAISDPAGRIGVRHR